MKSILPYLESALVRLVSFLLWAAPRLPEALLFRLAEGLGRIGYLLARDSRAVAARTLAAVDPSLPPSEVRRLTAAHFTHQFKNLAELFRYSLLSRKRVIGPKVRIEGLIHVERALREGRGVMLVLPHYGNWELQGAVWALLGYDLHIFYLDMRMRKLSDLLNRQRLRSGVHLIARSELKKSVRVLRENRILAVIADQDGGEAGIALPFFGRKVSFPPGAARLQRMTGATVLPNVLVREADDTYTFRLEPPVEMDRTSDKARDEIVNSWRILRGFERTIRRDPAQWLLSYDRFKPRRHVDALPEGWRDIPEIVAAQGA